MNGTNGSGVQNGQDSATRTVLVIDGSYAEIGSKALSSGKIDYAKLRSTLEEMEVKTTFKECWFFDQDPIFRKSPNQELSEYYTSLKCAPPRGPQFQLSLYAMKPIACHCPSCGHNFSKKVQKGVDNGIATKILSLAYENVADRFVLFAGDGDFYDSLNLVKNVLRKDLWVIGYRPSMSADLQQLATRVLWVEDFASRIMNVSSQPPRNPPYTSKKTRKKPSKPRGTKRQIEVVEDSQAVDSNWKHKRDDLIRKSEQRMSSKSTFYEDRVGSPRKRATRWAQKPVESKVEVETGEPERTLIVPSDVIELLSETESDSG